MPLNTSIIGESHWLLKHLKNTNHYKIYQLTIKSRQMLVNKDGVLQLPVDEVLWREIILMFWN